MKVEEIDSAKLGVPVSAKGDLGNVETPEPYKSLPMAEFIRLEGLFRADYEKLFEADVEGWSIEPALARSVLERMPVL